MINTIQRTTPSISVILFPVYPRTVKRIVTNAVNGISTQTVDFATATGTITEVIPRIINMFKILLPKTFPTVISALPFNAAVILTAVSGALVPIATIVRPITSCGIPNFSAIPAAPSTNQSAPFTSITKPSASNKTSNNNAISFSSI